MAAARAAGVECSALHKVSARPHEAILETAMDQNGDLIFTSSRGPKSIGGLMLGSETLKHLMEDSYLFMHLCGRTHAVDNVIAPLEAEHADRSLLTQLVPPDLSSL